MPHITFQLTVLRKTVAIRVWKKGGTGELFPKKLGISLKVNQWRGLCKISNKIYAEKMKVITFIPCLMQPDKTGHNKLYCVECADIDQAPIGKVDFNIPMLCQYISTCSSPNQ